MSEVNVINRSSLLTPSAGDNSFHINGLPKNMIKQPTEPKNITILFQYNYLMKDGL